MLRTHDDEEVKKENKAAHLRFSFDKNVSPLSGLHRRRIRDTFFNPQTDWKESGGTAALVHLGCTVELEEVEEEGRFSEMPSRLRIREEQ